MKKISKPCVGRQKLISCFSFQGRLCHFHKMLHQNHNISCLQILSIDVRSRSEIIRPQRWSIFQSDGMVDVFFKDDHLLWWFFNGFDTVGPSPLNSLRAQPLFSMVVQWFLVILRSMVNDGLFVPLDKKVHEINSRQNARKWPPVSTYSIKTLHSVQQEKGFPI